MQFLKIVTIAIVLPFILAALLLGAALGVAGFYFAWLVGVPVTVNLNGVKQKRRWLTRVA